MNRSGIGRENNLDGMGLRDFLVGQDETGNYREMSGIGPEIGR